MAVLRYEKHELLALRDSPLVNAVPSELESDVVAGILTGIAIGAEPGTARGIRPAKLVLAGSGNGSGGVKSLPFDIGDSGKLVFYMTLILFFGFSLRQKVFV